MQEFWDVTPCRRTLIYLQQTGVTTSNLAMRWVDKKLVFQSGWKKINFPSETATTQSLQNTFSKAVKSENNMKVMQIATRDAI
jgi:hypothetical protein